jgi:hypothetical protein
MPYERLETYLFWEHLWGLGTPIASILLDDPNTAKSIELPVNDVKCYHPSNILESIDCNSIDVPSLAINSTSI